MLRLESGSGLDTEAGGDLLLEALVGAALSLRLESGGGLRTEAGGSVLLEGAPVVAPPVVWGGEVRRFTGELTHRRLVGVGGGRLVAFPVASGGSGSGGTYGQPEWTYGQPSEAYGSGTAAAGRRRLTGQLVTAALVGRRED